MSAPGNNQEGTLDPTGMFRNRGRHVISRNAAPQNSKLRVNSGQISSAGSFNAEHAMGRPALYNNESGSTSPGRSLTDQGGAGPKDDNKTTDIIQSSGAPSGEKICSSSLREPRDLTPKGQIAFANTNGFTGQETAAESTSRSDNRLDELNAENLGLTPQEDSKAADEADSTVSIMGSMINDDLAEGTSLKKMDVVRWKSAIKNYSSNVRNDAKYVQEDAKYMHTIEKQRNEIAYHEIAASSEPMETNLDDPCNFNENDKDQLNASMECMLNESQVSSADEIDNIRSNVVQVADFSEMETGSTDSLNAEFAFSKDCGNDNETDTITGSQKYPTQSSPLAAPTPASKYRAHESPLRAAFRRTENNIRRVTSPMLPPSRDHMVQSSARLSRNSVLPLPLQLATKCFSFDDTTIDEGLTVPYQPQLGKFRQDLSKQKIRRQQNQCRQSPNIEYYGLSAVASFPDDESNALKMAIPLRRTSKSFSGVTSKRSPESIGSRHQQQSSDAANGQRDACRVIRRSKTWDHHINRETVIASQQSMQFDSETEDIATLVPSLQSTLDETLYERLKETKKSLLNIGTRTKNLNAQSVSQFRAILCQECATKTDNDIFGCEKCFEHLTKITKSIKEVNSSQTRSDAVDLLMECFNVVREVNKSAQTSLVWVDSLNAARQSTISKTVSETLVDKKDDEIARLNAEISSCREVIAQLRSVPESSVDRSMLSTSSEDSLDAHFRPDKSLVLYSPHPVVKLSESNDESFARFERRMDAELKVESMKEIIKLKAALEEANRKIASLENFNNSNVVEDPFPSDIEPITGSDNGEIFMKIAEDIENSTEILSPHDDFNYAEATASASKISLDDRCLEKELDEYRAAIIESVNASRVAGLAQDVSKSCDSEATEQKMISVRMLDAENFVTEWDSVSPLPPPPDHELHSPIVDAILSRWTDDYHTHHALLNWAEAILNGSNAGDVPPLKIAGLDHQLKEGFIMHVFPLLLRRKDIHVHLTSRATRTTSYDIAVSVSPAIDTIPHSIRKDNEDRCDFVPSHHSRDSKHHLMAFRATCNGSAKENDCSRLLDHHHPIFPDIVRSESNAGSCYTAVTTPTSNQTPSKTLPQMQKYMANYAATEAKKMNTSNEFPLEPQLPIMAGASPSLVDDLSVGSSSDEEDKVSRRQELRQSRIMNSIGGAFGLLSRKKYLSSNNNASTNAESHPNLYLTPKKQATNRILPYEYDHSYHRLVSAPPGKIGLTFVEHRGHCVVSNVTETSPLSGYVHPSDILIAIDDTPVSGLRTREIVSILTAKKDRRRDLRMISSHDMNDLIRPGTA